MSAIPFSLPTRFLDARIKQAVTLTESGFVFSARDGETYSLNSTGRCLFEALCRGVETTQIWQELCRRFTVSEELAQRDAQIFLARLYEFGLLELGPIAPPPSDAEEPPR